MTADPFPIPAPLIAAGIATLAAAVFACADTALTSLTEARLGALASEAHPGFQRALERLQAHRNRVQTRYLAGRVAANATVVACSTAWLLGLHAPIETLVLWAIVGLVLFTGVVQGAAATGRRTADWVVPVAARYLYPLELLLAPLGLVSYALGRIVGPAGEQQVDPRITEAEVELMVDQGEASGVLDRGNAEMIRKVLEFPELTAGDAMIPRRQVVAIRLDTPLYQVVDLVTSTGHSRYPVYREGIDDVFGLLYAKDLFRVLKPVWQQPGECEGGQSADSRPRAEDAPVSAESPSRRMARILDIVREPVKIVTESRPLSELLRDMRHSRQHMAIVVDEFGGMAGIVTLEDVLEQIVGDIRDEHDVAKAPIVTLPDGRLLVDAAVLICDLSAHLGSNLDPGDEYDSLGGMITAKHGEVPPVGTRIRTDGVELIVRDANDKHVTKVEIVPVERLTAASRGEPGGALKVG